MTLCDFSYIYRFSAFWLRSKCSICSYQLNLWYESYWALRDYQIFGTWWVVRACSPPAAGRPGIAPTSGIGPNPFGGCTKFTGANIYRHFIYQTTSWKYISMKTTCWQNNKVASPASPPNLSKRFYCQNRLLFKPSDEIFKCSFQMNIY